MDKVDPAILKLFPKDTIAFGVVNRVQGLMDNYEAFINAVFPPQIVQSMGSLPMVSGAMMGDMESYLNMDKSVAVVVLDFKKYAPDLLAPAPKKDGDAANGDGVQTNSREIVVKGGSEGSADSTDEKPAGADDAKKDSPEQAIPFALIIPSNNFKSFIEEKGTELEEKNGWQHGPDFAFKTKGDYTVVVWNKKCIEAFDSAETFDVSQSLVSQINSKDATVWVNYRKVGELKGTVAEDRLLAGNGMPYRIMMGMMSFPPIHGINYVFMTRGIVFTQAQDMVVGIKFSPEGLLATGSWSYSADSVMGKALAACKNTPKSLMDCLPAATGIFKYGADKSCLKTPVELKSEYFKATLKEVFPNIPDELAKKLLDVVMTYQDQVEGVQHYIGSASDVELPLGMGTIVRCKSPEQFIKQTEKTVEAINELFRYISENRENLDFSKASLQRQYLLMACSMVYDLTLGYTAGAETLSGNVKVDSVELDFPSMQSMSPEIAGKMALMLGESKLRVLIAQVDKDKVAITFAGGTPFLESMIESAKKPKAKTEVDPEAAASLEKLPANRVAIIAIDPAAFFNTTMEVMMAMGWEASRGIPKIEEPVPPIAASVSVDGTNLVITGFIPSISIRAIVDRTMATLR